MTELFDTNFTADLTIMEEEAAYTKINEGGRLLDYILQPGLDKLHGILLPAAC